MPKLTIFDCAIKHSSETCADRLASSLNFDYQLIRPPEEGLNNFKESTATDLIIIFGSASNVEDRLKWQEELAEICYLQLKRGTPVLGLCFGHQLMADRFGGEVVKAAREYKGIRKVTITHSGFGLKESEVFNLFVAHSFQVNPDRLGELKLLATSEDSPIDGLYHPELPYLGFQGHPEGSRLFYDRDISPDAPLDEEDIKLGLNDGLSLMERVLKSYLK